MDPLSTPCKPTCTNNSACFRREVHVQADHLLNGVDQVVHVHVVAMVYHVQFHRDIGSSFLQQMHSMHERRG